MRMISLIALTDVRIKAR